MSIIFKGISYAFNPCERKSADIFFDLVVEQGDVIGLIGQSGSGKSSILEIIAGIRLPQSGSLCFNGVNIYSDHTGKCLRDYKSRISFVSQNSYICPASVSENIELLAFMTDQECHHYSLREIAGMTCIPVSKSDDINFHLKSPIDDAASNLSGGQKQRIGIARALYKNHDMLLLDEATSALDPEMESILIANLAKYKQSRSIIMAAHRYSTLSICNKVLLIENGLVKKKYEGSSLKDFLKVRGVI